MEKVYSTRGTEILIDVWDMERPFHFDNADVMEEAMRQALNVEGIVPVEICSKKFEPHGLTMMMLLEESHFNIHLYSEHNFLASSVYTCGSANTDNIVDKFIELLNPAEVYRQKVKRGIR